MRSRGKSSANPNLSTLLLKDAFETFASEITHLLNKSLIECLFPVSWKMGCVTLLTKTGDILHPNDWHPITQIPLMGKLFERVSHGQINNYFANHDIFNDYHYGFRKNKSTMHAVFKLITDLSSGMDKSESTNIVY